MASKFETLRGIMKNMEDPEMIMYLQKHDEDIAKARTAEEFKNEKKSIHTEFKTLLGEKIGNIKNIGDLNKLIYCLKKCIGRKKQTRGEKNKIIKPQSDTWVSSSDEENITSQTSPPLNDIMARYSIESPSSRSPTQSTSMEQGQQRPMEQGSTKSSAAVNNAIKPWRFRNNRFMVPGSKTPSPGEVKKMREKAYRDGNLNQSPHSPSPNLTFQKESRFIPYPPQSSKEYDGISSGSNNYTSGDDFSDTSEFKNFGEGRENKKKTVKKKTVKKKKVKKKKANTKKANTKKGKKKKGKKKKGGKRKHTKGKTKKNTRKGLNNWLKKHRTILEKGPPRGIISNAWVRKTCPCRKGDDCVPCSWQLKKYKDGRKKTKKN